MAQARTAIVPTTITAYNQAGERVTLEADVYTLVLRANGIGAAVVETLYLCPAHGRTDAVRVELPELGDIKIPIIEGTEPFWNSAVGHPAGMVVAICGHAMAASEWLAGFRKCERCA